VPCLRHEGVPADTASGMIVEHWACRDDMGLPEQRHD
jgi:hypothetical protein